MYSDWIQCPSRRATFAAGGPAPPEGVARRMPALFGRAPAAKERRAGRAGDGSPGGGRVASAAAEGDARGETAGADAAARRRERRSTMVVREVVWEVVRRRMRVVPEAEGEHFYGVHFLRTPLNYRYIAGFAGYPYPYP